MVTRGRQRTSYPARSGCLLFRVWWHSGSGGQGGPEGSGLPGDVCQHLGDVQTPNLAVNQLISQLKVIRRVQISASPFFCVIVCFLLQPWALFIIFIYPFGGVADCQTWECTHHFFSVKQQPRDRPTGRRSSAITSSLAAAEIDSAKKSKLELISTCQATSQLDLAVFLVAAWASEVWGVEGDGGAGSLNVQIIALVQEVTCGLKRSPRKEF